MPYIITARFELSLRCVLCGGKFDQPTRQTRVHPITRVESFEYTCPERHSAIWRTLT